MSVIPAQARSTGQPIFVGLFARQTAWWWIFAGLLLFVAPMSAPNMGPIDWITWFFAASTSLLLLAPVAFTRDFDIFQPITFVTLSVLIGTTARTMYIFASNDPDVRSNFLRGQPTSFFLAPSVLMFLAICALMAGYYYKPSAPTFVQLKGYFDRLNRPWAAWQTVAIIVLLNLISFVGLYIFIRILILQGDNVLANISSKHLIKVHGGGSYSALGYLRLMMRMSTLAFLLGFAWFSAGKKSFWSVQGFAVIGLGLFAAFPPFFNSSRSEIIIIPMIAMATWNYTRTRLTMRSVMVATVVAIGILGFMGALRAQKDDNFASAATGTLSTEVFEKLVDNYNFISLPTTAHVMEAMPEKLAYQYGQTLFLWVYAPIPRTIWPEKPDVVTGQVIAKAVFGRGFGKGGGTPPNIVSDFYWNFGIPGVMVGMFFFGCFLRFLYFNALPNLDNNKTALLLYLIIMVPMTHGIADASVSAGIVAMLTAVIPIMVLLPFILARKNTPKEPVS
jgi:oligosaccharide repeat unit polymerase